MTKAKTKAAPKRKRVAATVPKRPPAKHRALMLRTCAEDMTAHGGFTWPVEGYVACPDWSPEPVCGYGLHGLLWGEGDGSLLSWDPGARWLVCEVDAREVVELTGKVKVPRAWVLYCGDRLGATAYLAERAPGRAIVGGTATAGYAGTATAGDRGTATAGDAGELRIRWWDGRRYRTVVAYVGEGGVEADVAYRLDERGQIVRAS